MRLFYTDHYEIPLPPGHKFPMRKYRMLRDRLAEAAGFRMEAALFTDAATIALAHDPAYIAKFLEGGLDAAEIRRIGFPWSEALVRRTLASVGGTLAAARAALEEGAAGNLAGGTHHAFRGCGSGFCVFNDIAVAILALLSERLIERAAVIDLDVHQGDGTAQIFEEDRRVLTLSMHGKNNFPFRKQQSKIDIELADETADGEYLEKLACVLPRVFEFRPEMVLYQSGVDALADDRLGRLALTHEGLKERDRVVFEACRERRVPVAVTLGGGYAEPIEQTVEAHANTFRTALKMFS